MKYEWIKNWILHKHWHSGEMIRTWFLINGFKRCERYMRKKLKEKRCKM